MLHGNYSGTASHAVTALEGIRKQFGGARFRTSRERISCASIPPFRLGAYRPTMESPDSKREYFAGDLTGTPQVTRVDPLVDLQTSRFIPTRRRFRAGRNEGFFGALDWIL